MFNLSFFISIRHAFIIKLCHYLINIIIRTQSRSINMNNSCCFLFQQKQQSKIDFKILKTLSLSCQRCNSRVSWLFNNHLPNIIESHSLVLELRSDTEWIDTQLVCQIIQGRLAIYTQLAILKKLISLSVSSLHLLVEALYYLLALVFSISIKIIPKIMHSKE